MLSSMMLTFTFKLGVSCLARSSSVPAEGNINLCTQHSQLTECALHIYGGLNRNTTVASQLVTTQQRLKQPTNKLTSVTDISQLADEASGNFTSKCNIIRNKSQLFTQVNSAWPSLCGQVQ